MLYVTNSGHQVLGPPARGVPFEASQHSGQAGTKEQGVAACILATPTNALPPRAQESTCVAIRWRSLAAATPEGSMLVVHSCRPLRPRRSPADRSAHHTTSRSQAACAPLCWPGRWPTLRRRLGCRGRNPGAGEHSGGAADASQTKREALGCQEAPAASEPPGVAATPCRCGTALAAPPTPRAEGVGGLCVNGVLSAAPPPHSGARQPQPPVGR